MQVLKGMTYLLSVFPTGEIHVDSVRLSLHGDVKLGMPLYLIVALACLPIALDMHYQTLPEEVTVDRQYNSDFLARILEVLMPSGTLADQVWSREALEFSAIPRSDSLAPFINVSLPIDLHGFGPYIK
jgi:hypothetical protein